VGYLMAFQAHDEDECDNIYGAPFLLESFDQNVVPYENILNICF
jgi:hypothetical protein